LTAFFNYGYNPATDYIKPNNKRKKTIHFLEIILGLPFSLFLLKEYSIKGNENYVSDLHNLIQKRFGKSVLESNINFYSCRDYIRTHDKELGSVAMKMAAESAMCRSLAIVFFLSDLASIYTHSLALIVINSLLCTLSIANFSYRRRLYATQVYNIYFAIEKNNPQKSSATKLAKGA
jgi:hypothetical protein